jgi:hypothetical protein
VSPGARGGASPGEAEASEGADRWSSERDGPGAEKGQGVMAATVVIHSKRARFQWTLSWRERFRVAACVLFGRPFEIEGEFTSTGVGEVAP